LNGFVAHSLIPLTHAKIGPRGRRKMVGASNPEPDAHTGGKGKSTIRMATRDVNPNPAANPPDPLAGKANESIHE
jgi:hypothetical protein